MCGTCGKSVQTNQVWDGNAPYIGCCKVANGYYCIWNDEAMALECEDWVELCMFREVLRQVSHISFQVVSERDRARTALNNMKRKAPFEMCKRFPLGKSYVNISCSTYADMLERILGALDFKDRESEKEMKYSEKREQADKDQTARRNYSIDDASTAFRKTMVVLQNELCKRNNVFTRFSFEKYYSLTWCVGDCPVPSEGGEPPNRPPGTPPGQPPTQPPNQPTGTYQDFMKKIDDLQKDSTSFSVFSEADMVKGIFECGRTGLQRLNNDSRTKRLPAGSDVIYIFTQGEYEKCPGEVRGYRYIRTTNTLEGEVVLNPRLLDREFEAIVVEVAKVLRAGKWPNSKLKKAAIPVDTEDSYDAFDEYASSSKEEEV